MPPSSIPAIIAARRNSGDGLAEWSSPLAPLPADIEEILKCAAGDSAAVAAASAAAGARPVVAESACRWFIRHVLFRPGASYYWNLGVERDASLELIRAHYRHLISVFHPDRLQQSDERDWYESFAKRVNEAYNTLKNTESRSRYDRLQATQAGSARPDSSSPPSASPPGGPTSARKLRPESRLRWSWRTAPEQSAVADWAAGRSPRTLKVLAVLAGTLALLGALMWVRFQEHDKRDIALPAEASEAQAPSHAEEGASFERLASLLENSAGATAATPVAASPVADMGATVRGQGATATPPVAAERRAAKLLSAPAPEPPVKREVAVNRAPADQAEPAKKTEPVPPPSERMIIAGTSVAVVEPAAPPSSVEAPSAPKGMALAVASPVATAATAAMAVLTPIPEGKREPALPSAAEVDALIVRFAHAYESGDVGAFAGLMDPGAMRDAQMASTMAGFVRVFHQTSRRRIELKVLQRSDDGEVTRVRLQARATTVGKDDVPREDIGLLTLVIRKADKSAVIEGMDYRT